MPARRPQPGGLVPIATDLRRRSSSTMSPHRLLLAPRISAQAAPAKVKGFSVHHTRMCAHARTCGGAPLLRRRCRIRPNAAAEGAAAVVLLRRARLGALRRDLRAAGVLP